jgi:hypothetical protein
VDQNYKVKIWSPDFIIFLVIIVYLFVVCFCSYVYCIFIFIFCGDSLYASLLIIYIWELLQGKRDSRCQASIIIRGEENREYVIAAKLLNTI